MKTALILSLLVGNVLWNPLSASAAPACADLAGNYYCTYSHPVHFKLSITQRLEERKTVYHMAYTELSNHGDPSPDHAVDVAAIAVDEAGPTDAFCVSDVLFTYGSNAFVPSKNGLYYWTVTPTSLESTQVGHPFDQFRCDRI